MDPDYARCVCDVTRWGLPTRCQEPANLLLSKLKTFSTIELAFERYPELLNSKRKVNLVVQEFKCVMPLAFCNLIGPPRLVHVDRKWYRQSPTPSLRVFILKELNAVVGTVWYRDGGENHAVGMPL